MLGKNFSTVPEYPEDFILSNAQKLLQNELKTPLKSKRKKEIKSLLKLPIVIPLEQNNLVLPGNGVMLHFKDTDEKMYCVLDGTQRVKSHDLPKGTKIITASSSLGKSLMGKTPGMSLTAEDSRNCIVEYVHAPSVAKWLFKFQDLKSMN